jgi:hypothetical protein
MPGTGDACQDAAASAGTFPELPASRRLLDPGGASSDVTVIEIPETNAGRLQNANGVIVVPACQSRAERVELPPWCHA